MAAAAAAAGTRPDWPCNLADALAADAEQRLLDPGRNVAPLHRAVVRLAVELRALLQLSRTAHLSDETLAPVAALVARLAPDLVRLSDAEYARALNQLTAGVRQLVAAATQPAKQPGQPRRIAIGGVQPGPSEPEPKAEPEPPAAGLVSRLMARMAVLVLIIQVAVFVFGGMYRVAVSSKRVAVDLGRLDPVTTWLFWIGTSTTAAWAPNMLLLMSDAVPMFVPRSRIDALLPAAVGARHRAMAIVVINAAILVAAASASNAALGIVRSRVQRSVVRTTTTLWRRVWGAPAAGVADAVGLPLPQPLLDPLDQAQAGAALANGLELAAEAWEAGAKASERGVALLPANPRAGARDIALGIRSSAVIGPAQMDELADLVVAKLVPKLARLFAPPSAPVRASGADVFDAVRATDEVIAMLDQGLASIAAGQ